MASLLPLALEAVLMRYVIISLALLTIAAVAQTPSEPFHIKDDVLGEPLSDWQRNHQQPLGNILLETTPSSFPSHRCKVGKMCQLTVMDCSFPDSGSSLPLTGDASGIQSCTNIGLTPKNVYTNLFTVKYAGQLAQFQRVNFLHQRLYEVLYVFDRESCFTNLRDSLIAKFGPPSQSSSETLQNRMGATFTGQVALWHNAVSTITLHEYSSDINTTTLMFSLDELEKEASTLQKQAVVGQALKDM